MDFLEDTVIQFIIDMTHKAMEIGRPGRVQVEDIIIPVESVEDGVEISVGVDSVNIMEGVAIA